MPIDFQTQFRTVQLQRNLRLQQTHLRSAICERLRIIDEFFNFRTAERESNVRSGSSSCEVDGLDIDDLKLNVPVRRQLPPGSSHHITLAQIVAKRFERIEV